MYIYNIPYMSTPNYCSNIFYPFPLKVTSKVMELSGGIVPSNGLTNYKKHTYN